MSRVTLTINLDLECAGLPSSEALSAALYRAQNAAARVFVNGDLGGPMHVTVDPSPNPIPKTCEALDVLPGRMFASVGKRKKRAELTPSSEGTKQR
jgi:hypothetical protein